MAMDSQQGHLIAAALALRAGKGGDAAQVADAIVSTWREIAAVLTPIVGRLGVAALYWRSLHLAGQQHRWLLSMHGDAAAEMDLDMLKSFVAKQRSADAAAGGGAFLGAFREMLASLVGHSLTDRLLRPVWADFLSGDPAQGSSR